MPPRKPKAPAKAISAAKGTPSASRRRPPATPLASSSPTADIHQKQAEKARLRDIYRHRRSVIPLDLQSTTKWKVINHLRTLIADTSPTVVALYHPLEGEIDLTPLAQELWRDGQTVCLPRVHQRGHALVFNVWPPFGRLEPDALGIPSATGPEILPSLIILPMLGYSRKGYRLGTGGGYYDKTLKDFPTPVQTIGVCYTELEVSNFPHEHHDKKLDYITTGKEVIVIK